jgi:hypothetical protein
MKFNPLSRHGFIYTGLYTIFAVTQQEITGRVTIQVFPMGDSAAQPEAEPARPPLQQALPNYVTRGGG